ncbi:MAG: DMT family transporter [Aestuariivirgaceae bacterium]|nr:DMT family transporter [Aestuariivirgaceae bacterium]
MASPFATRYNHPMNTSAIKQSMGLAEWAMLITLSMIWGGSFFFNRIAVSELPVFTIVALRVGIAACILWLIVLATRTPLPGDRKTYQRLFLLGFINSVIPFSLIVWGQTRIGSGPASILNATTPFFTIIVANAFLADERLTWQKFTGVIIGIAGVAAMIGVSAFEDAAADVIAELALIGASIAYALGTTFARQFRSHPPLIVATGQITSAALIITPIAIIADQAWTLPLPRTEVMLSVASLAALCTAFAYLLYFRILRSAGATNVALVTFLVPVSAILLGILFLGEHLEWRHLTGMAAISAGLALIDGRLIRRFTNRAAA